VDSDGSKHVLGDLGDVVHTRHLANTIEPSPCGGDAAFLSDYFDYLLLVLSVLALETKWCQYVCPLSNNSTEAAYLKLIFRKFACSVTKIVSGPVRRTGA